MPTAPRPPATRRTEGRQTHGNGETTNPASPITSVGSATAIQAEEPATPTSSVSPSAEVIERTRARSLRARVGRVLSVVVPAVLWFAPLPIDVTARHALAIGLFMILAWITDAMPHAVAGLVGCYLFWALGVVKFEAAFSGFATETPWFFCGALLFGMLATETGLARRIAVHVLGVVGNSYSRVLLGFILLSFLLTFLIPSGVACVLIMGSIAVGLLQAYGYGRGSNLARGIFITLTYTAGLFDKMVIAGPSSILGRGLIVKTTHVELLWSKWLLAYLPMSLVTIFVIWRLIQWLYPPEQEQLSGGEEYLRRQKEALGPWTRREIHALALMLFAIGMWATDSLHHITPAMVGLGVGLLAVLPGVGVLTYDEMKRCNYMMVFFVAAAASMGQVLSQTKALDVLTRAMFSWMGPLVTGRFGAVFVPYWAAFGYHIFLGNEISMLSTSVPPLIQFAIAHGLSPVATGMIWSFAAGGKIFVYQSAVMIVGYSFGYFDTRDMLRVGALLSIVESLLLLVVVPFYWPLIGIR